MTDHSASSNSTTLPTTQHRVASSPEAAYLTPSDLARELQVSDKTIYRWAATDSTMPVLRIGGVVRFPRERTMRWLRDREQGIGRLRSRKPLNCGPQVPVTASLLEPANGSCAAPCAENGAIHG